MLTLLATTALLLPQTAALTGGPQEPSVSRAAAPQEPTADSAPLLRDIPLLSHAFGQEQKEAIPDPELQWNGETEDSYRRAMHLIQVRGRYEQGIELLLGMADTQQVIQIPGQASWVLAQAALAMAQSGRSAEALELLPGIQKGAAGTDFERQVNYRVSQVEQLQEADDQPLDDSFRRFLWERLKEYPRDDKDRGNDITGYGRLALPYLEELIQGQLALGAAGHGGDIVQASKATRFAMRLADEGFAHRFAALLQQYPPLTTRVLLDGVGVSSLDETAERAQITFYSKLAQDDSSARRDLGTERLADCVRRFGSTEGATLLLELAVDGTETQQSLITDVLRAGGTTYSTEEWRAFFERAAVSKDADLREAARWGMLQDGLREPLARYAEADGRTVDKLRYLATFCRVEDDSSQANHSRRGKDSSAELEDAVRSALAEAGFFTSMPYSWGENEVSGEQDRARITRLAADPHAGVAAYACLIAAESRDDKLKQSVFQATDGPLQAQLLTALTSRGRWDYDAETAEVLLRMAQDGSEQAFHLLNSTGMRHLKVATLVSSGLDWSVHQGNAGWYAACDTRRRMADWEELAEILKLPAIHAETRHGFLRVLAREARDKFLDTVATHGAWEMGDGPEAANLYNWILQSMVQLDPHMKGAVDVPGPLWESVVDGAWGLVDEHPEYLHALSFSAWFEAYWRSDPEGAYEQALRLIQTPEDLDRYLGADRYDPFPEASSALVQRLEWQLIQRGIWDPSVRNLRLVDDSQPEFESLVRHLFASPETARYAISYVNAADDRYQEDFAAELDAAWSNPALAIHVLFIYDGTPAIREKVPQLLRAWEVEGLHQRPDFLRAMGSTLDERVVPVLLDQLGSTDAKCREAAQDALESMRQIREQREFWATWQATGSSVSPTVALIRKLSSDKQEVRLAAIRSLGTMKSPEALPFLVELLEDENQAVREAAAAALKKINDAE